MNNPAYLGDGVYAHVDDYGCVVLTTGHHDPAIADNTIVFEPEVLRAFDNWRKEPVQQKATA